MTFVASSNNSEMWKKLVDSMKELVTEGNIQCDPNGMNLQAMDSAHVALVSMSLVQGAFKKFECAVPQALGINMSNLSKILKTIDSKDQLTFAKDPDSNTLAVTAEEPKGANRKSTFDLKLMDIESEDMGVPEIEYKSSISMGSSEFARVCRDMNVLGDTITVAVDRNGVSFSADGDIGSGKHSYKCNVSIVRAGGDDALPAVKEEPAVKAEVKDEVKAEVGDDDDDDIDEDAPLALRIKKTNKKAKGDDDDDDDDKKSKAVPVTATMIEPTELSFALRYFTIFSKASALADRVTISLSQEHPCMIEFAIEKAGHLRFFLAPKVEAAE